MNPKFWKLKYKLSVLHVKTIDYIIHVVWLQMNRDYTLSWCLWWPHTLLLLLERDVTDLRLICHAEVKLNIDLDNPPWPNRQALVNEHEFKLTMPKLHRLGPLEHHLIILSKTFNKPEVIRIVNWIYKPIKWVSGSYSIGDLWWLYVSMTTPVQYPALDINKKAPFTSKSFATKRP